MRYVLRLTVQCISLFRCGRRESEIHRALPRSRAGGPSQSGVERVSAT